MSLTSRLSFLALILTLLSGAAIDAAAILPKNTTVILAEVADAGAQYCSSKCPASSSLFQSSISPGDSIFSPGTGYRFTLQNDGNTVLYSSFVPNQECPLWDSGTWNKPTNSLVMQADGNLVGYDAQNHPLWSSGTYGRGKGPYCFTVQDDSNIVIYDSTCSPIWSRNNFPDQRNCPTGDLVYNQGGDVMSNTENGVTIYPVFYGTGFPDICDSNNQNCNSADKMSIYFLQNIIYYPWFNILHQYSGLNNDYIHARINVANPIYDPSSSTDLPDGFIENYVANDMVPKFNNGKPDPNGIYLFMTGQSVQNLNDTAADADYSVAAGWHFGFDNNGASLKYIIVNQINNAVTVLSHELAESLTDPAVGDEQLTYYDNKNNGEIADLCISDTYFATSFPGSPYISLPLQELFSNQDNYRCVSKPAQVARTCMSKCPLGSSLYQNDYLSPGQSLNSPKGTYRFTIQTDGNVVGYKNANNCPFVSTGTFSSKPGSLAMQADGNLVAYYYDRAPWASDTQYHGEGPYCLTMQEDSNVVVYDANCNPVWARSNFPDLQGC